MESEDEHNRQTLDILDSLAIENFTSEKCLSGYDHFPSKVNTSIINNSSSDGSLITVLKINNTSLIEYDHNKINNITNPNNINKQKIDECLKNTLTQVNYFHYCSIMKRKIFMFNIIIIFIIVFFQSMSSYRYESDNEVSRPETPAFPVTPRTPHVYGSTNTLPPKSPTLQR